MKKIIILIALLFTTTAQAKIEIKHWQVGSEWTKTAESYSLSVDSVFESNRLKLTLAGATVDRLFVLANADKTKSMYLAFTLDSDHFEAVKDAIGTKYSLTCEKSTVTNAMGAKFINEYCSYTEDGDELVLEKYDGKISEMSLTIANNKDLDEWNKKKDEEKKSDI